VETSRAHRSGWGKECPGFTNINLFSDIHIRRIHTTAGGKGGIKSGVREGARSDVKFNPRNGPVVGRRQALPESG